MECNHRCLAVYIAGDVGGYDAPEWILFRHTRSILASTGRCDLILSNKAVEKEEEVDGRVHKTNDAESMGRRDPRRRGKGGGHRKEESLYAYS